MRERRWKLKQDIYVRETNEFAGHRLNPVAQLGNEGGNPTIHVPLQVAIRSCFAGGCAMISVSGISSSVCPSDSSLARDMCNSALCFMLWLCYAEICFSVVQRWRCKMKLPNTCSKSSGYSECVSVWSVIRVIWFFLFPVFHLFQLYGIIESWLCWKVRWLRFF